MFVQIRGWIIDNKGIEYYAGAQGFPIRENTHNELLNDETKRNDLFKQMCVRVIPDFSKILTQYNSHLKLEFDDKLFDYDIKLNPINEWELRVWIGIKDYKSYLLNKLSSTIKLLVTPKDPILKNKNFQATFPAYCWDLFNNITACFEGDILTMLLIHYYLQVCTDTEDGQLLNNTHYLRFDFYQDSPQSDSYCYGFIKKINDCSGDCSGDYRKLLDKYPKDKILCEYIINKRGFFIYIDKQAWINKKVELKHLTEGD